MKKGLITTIPLEPKNNLPKLGILAPPIVADFFHRRYSNLELKVSLNSLDSIREREKFTEGFLRSLEYFGINKDQVWIDSHNIVELLNNINSLENKGFLKVEKRKRLISPSKDVEVLGDISISPRSRFIKKVGEFYYDINGGKLSPINNDSLILRLPILKNYPRVFPKNMEKEVKYHLNKIQNIEMLVSRERETGFKIKIENQDFNLDIDLLWATYLHMLMKNKDIGIVVGSNHTIWHSSLSYSLFKSLEEKNEKEITLYFLPYLLSNTETFSSFASGEYLKTDPNLSRLLVLNSLSPHKKNVYWPENFLQYKILERIKGLRKSSNFSRERYNSSDALNKTVDLLRKSNIEKAIKIKKDYDEQLDIDIRGMII